MFPRLSFPNQFYTNQLLQGEPFSAVIADRVQELCRLLNEYMASRQGDGSDSGRTVEMVRAHFSGAAGARPLFTGESVSNQTAFRTQMTFPDPGSPGKDIFAHWHGKISHRYFRMHFEWPVPRGSRQMKVLYLGPKLTKD
jgi:hypothetical protein